MWTQQELWERELLITFGYFHSVSIDAIGFIKHVLRILYGFPHAEEVWQMSHAFKMYYSRSIANFTHMFNLDIAKM